MPQETGADGDGRRPARAGRRATWPSAVSTSSPRSFPVPWSELHARAARAGSRCARLRATRGSTSCRTSCARAGCTRSARRPAAPTSASAGGAARPRSRSWARCAPEPAATARSPRAGRPSAPDPLEPARVARAVEQMGLGHVVITSVDRDDLPDRGAGHFAATIRAIRRRAPGVRHRGAGARLPRLSRGGAARRARGRPRRLQPQHRDGRAALPPGPTEGRLPAGARPARSGQGRVGRALPRARRRSSPRAGSSSAWARPTRRWSG